MAFLSNQFSQEKIGSDENGRGLGFSGRKETSPDDLQIHTMEEDLRSPSNYLKKSPSFEKNNSSLFSSSRESGPFSQSNSKMGESGNVSSEKESGEKLLWTIALSLLILFLFFVGGYYYLILNEKKSQSESSENLSNSANNSPPIKNSPLETIVNNSSNSNSSSSDPSSSLFSTENANYLPLDVSQSTASVRAEIKNYFDLVKNGNYSSVIEFIPTDKSTNSPLTLETFSQKIGLAISSTLRNSLDQNYSLFIFNDSSGPHLGMRLRISNEVQLKKDLAQEENSLPKYFLSLLPDGSSGIGASFSSSQYNGADVRYVNISGNNEYSIDYTIFKSYLLVGTSKMTLRSMIDYSHK